MLPGAARRVLDAEGNEKKEVYRFTLTAWLLLLSPLLSSLLSFIQSLPSSVIAARAEGAIRDTQPACLSVWMKRIQIKLPAGVFQGRTVLAKVERLSGACKDGGQGVKILGRIRCGKPNDLL